MAFHIKYAAKFGFFFCLLVYIAGLKFFPGLAFHVYTQAGLFGTPDTDGLDFDGVMGDSGGEKGQYDGSNSGSSAGNAWWQVTVLPSARGMMMRDKEACGAGCMVIMMEAPVIVDI